MRLLYHRLIAEQGFPLELKVPNAETQAAMAEADEILAKRRARFAGPAALMASLETPDEE